MHKLAVAAISATIFATLTVIPTLAQRGGGARGGSISARGSFSAPAARPSPSFSGRPTYSAPRSVAPTFRPGLSALSHIGTYRPSSIYRRPGYGREGAYRTPYIPIPYAYPGLYNYAPFASSFYDDDSFNEGPVQTAAQPGYTDQQPSYGSSASPQPYPPAPAPPDTYRPAYTTGRPQPVPAEEDAVTLIFKDGRPAQQIHNYILSPTTLYVEDGRHREIALVDLDLPATAQANRAAGITFQLPQAR